MSNLLMPSVMSHSKLSYEIWTLHALSNCTMSNRYHTIVPVPLPGLLASCQNNCRKFFYWWNLNLLQCQYRNRCTMNKGFWYKILIKSLNIWDFTYTPYRTSMVCVIFSRIWLYGCLHFCMFRHVYWLGFLVY